MSLLIILLLGASMGWLASIVLRDDTPRAVLARVGVGVVGAFVCGVMASSVSLLEGVTLATLLAAALGAAGLLAAIHVLARHRLRHPGGHDAANRSDRG